MKGENKRNTSSVQDRARQLEFQHNKGKSIGVLFDAEFMTTECSF